MSRSHEPSNLAIIVSALAIVGAMTLLGAGFNAVKCNGAWADSGMKSRYQFGAGCLVQRKDGTWVPAGAIRELSP